MTTRSEIQDTLAAAQEKVIAYFEGLSPEALESPCTASGVPGEVPWRAKDHFAHLTANEQGIQTLLRLTLTGESLPDNLATMSTEERLAWSNQRNQTYVNAHRNDSMETLRAYLSTAHQETLDLLEQFTDEQLAAPVSLSFMTNMTAGNLFVANAQHAAMHITWIEEGFRQGL
ncbi:MAG TPA: DinB family protein [Ktedonobacteraceae bacterium]|jgi:hypothetical protein